MAEPRAALADRRRALDVRAKGKVGTTPASIEAAPPREGASYRALLGLVAVLGGLGGLGALYFVPIPPGNRDALMLALGLVLGWGSTVIGYEFGSSPAGRMAADAGVKQPERGVSSK